MRLLLLAFVLVVIPFGASAIDPTSTLEDSSESVTREVKRKINLATLRQRLRERFTRAREAVEIIPVAEKQTVVRRTQRSVGSVNTVGYVAVKLAKLDHKVSIPEGFVVVSDTLEQDSGKAIYRSGTNIIEIHASGMKCPASGTSLRNCVQSNTKAFADAFAQEDRRLQFLRQRQDNQLLLDVSTKSDPFGSERDRVIESLELQSSTKKISVLGFASPEDEYLWYLVLKGNTNRETSIGHDHQALYRIFNSLSHDETPKAVPARTRIRSSFRSRDRFRSNYRFRSNRSDVGASQVFVSKHLPELGLHLDVLEDARLVQDGIDGVYIFDSEDGRISVQVMDEECHGNTSSLLQRCLRQILATIDDTPEGFRLLTEKNILMQLDTAVGYKSHLGRYIFWQRHQEARKGILIFRHPWEKTVFRVDFSADNEDNNWLYNEVLLNKFLSSFYFDERD